MKNPKFKIAAALVAMFLFGAITGAGLSPLLHPYFFSPPNAKDMQEHLANILTLRLNLTPEQQEKLKPIVASFTQQVQNLNEQSMTQISLLADATDNQISQFLTAEQKVELAKLAQERKAFAQHGPLLGFPPGPPGPPPSSPFDAPPGPPSGTPPGPPPGS